MSKKIINTIMDWVQLQQKRAQYNKEVNIEWKIEFDHEARRLLENKPCKTCKYMKIARCINNPYIKCKVGNIDISLIGTTCKYYNERKV